MPLSKEDLILIKGLREEKKWSKRKICKFYQSKGWSESSVAYAIKKLEETGDIDRRIGSGRPKSARTQDNIDAVEELVLSQEDKPGTHKTPREIARILPMSHQSVRNIADKDLELNVFKKMISLKISAPNRAKRRKKSAGLRKRFRCYCRIWFSDEKICL